MTCVCLTWISRNVWMDVWPPKEFQWSKWSQESLTRVIGATWLAVSEKFLVALIEKYAFLMNISILHLLQTKPLHHWLQLYTYTKVKLKHAVFHRIQMVSMRTQCAEFIHWDKWLFWIKSSGRPLMDRHNAPAVLSFSKGGTTFFIKMSLIKLMKAWLPQESTCWRMHAFGGKNAIPLVKSWIYSPQLVCCCVDDAHRPKNNSLI